MADRGKKIDPATQRSIQKMIRENVSLRKTAAAAHVSKRTVQKYKSPPPPTR